MTQARLPTIRNTLQCSRCRKIILNSSEAVIVAVGNFPPRRLCEECGRDAQLFLVTQPEMAADVPLDLSPQGSLR